VDYRHAVFWSLQFFLRVMFGKWEAEREPRNENMAGAAPIINLV